MGYECDEFTPHGFRAMASTLLNEQGYHSDAIERQLAHVPHERIRGIYNRAEYLPERRKMMDDWANYLDELRERARRNLWTRNSISFKEVAAARIQFWQGQNIFAVFFVRAF